MGDDMNQRMRGFYESSVRGVLIFLSIFVALLIFQFAAASVTITQKGSWESCEPGFHCGWTVAFQNPFDGLFQIEDWI